MFKTHVVFSLFLALLYLSFYNVSDLVLFFIVFFIGVMAPDMDNPMSKIGRKFKLTSNLIKFIFGHRGIFHSLIFLVLIYFILRSFSSFTALWFSAGYLTHLIGDALTLEGVNFLYPLRLEIKGFLRTGGAVEYAIFIFLLVVDAFMIWTRVF